jgi:hypothetical protein
VIRKLQRRAVFTALIGGYELLTEQPAAAGGGTDLVCFTDDPGLKSDTWQVRLIEPRFPRDTVRSARRLKILGPELLADYDETLWIDNSVELRCDPCVIFDEWLAEHDLALPLHSFRQSVVAEFDAVERGALDDAARIHEQLIAYAAIRPATLEERPYWTAILARRRSRPVLEAMQLWYEQVLRHSRRDQLSINYVLGVSACPTRGLPIDNYKSAYHLWPVGKDRNKAVWRSNLGSALRIPAMEIGRLQNRVSQLEALVRRERAQHAQALAEAQHDAALARLRDGKG